jgi:L-fuconolactonase
MLDHFGGVKLSKEPLSAAWIESFRQAAKCPNVYCKVSALYGRFEQQPAPKELSAYQPILKLALESFGEDRIVFGSDWPVTRTTGDYASVLKLTHSFFDEQAPSAVEKLFSRNARAFYGLD